MSAAWIGFMGGCFAGGALGVILMGACSMAGEGARSEEYRETMRKLYIFIAWLDEMRITHPGSAPLMHVWVRFSQIMNEGRPLVAPRGKPGLKAEAPAEISPLPQDLTVRDLIQEIVDNDDTPEPNCSCHISTPCSDCVEHSWKREWLAQARAWLKAGAEVKP